MQKKRRIITCCIIIVIITLVIVAGVIGYKNAQKEAESIDPNSPEQIEKQFGFVEEQNVTAAITKYNTEIKHNNLEYQLEDINASIENNRYYFTIFEDIVCYITPVQFTGNRDNDIVSNMGIYYLAGSQNETMAIDYVRKLIEANNNELKLEETTYLMEQAKNNPGEQAKNGSGLLVEYSNTGNRIEYQVTRHVKGDGSL